MGGCMNLMLRRRAMMDRKNAGLPAGYSFCDYIDLKTNFNPNQHVDSKFKPNQDSRCVIDFIVFERGSSAANVIPFGCQTPRFACAIDYAGDKIRGDYNNTVGTAVSGYLALGVRGVAELNKNKFYYNDNLIQTFNYTTFNTNRNLWIGALNGYNNVGGNFYIYSCKIYDNGVMVRDYYPCADGSNVGYLWDDVNKRIYPFAYTGAIGGYDD